MENMVKPQSRTSKTLTPDQQNIFLSKGFNTALLHAVIKKGWDKKDIDNYILVHNHNTGSHVSIPVLTVGMNQEIARMKRAANRGTGRGRSSAVSTRGSQKSVPAGSGGVKQPHRYRPGTVALREI